MRLLGYRRRWQVPVTNLQQPLLAVDSKDARHLDESGQGEPRHSLDYQDQGFRGKESFSDNIAILTVLAGVPVMPLVLKRILVKVCAGGGEQGCSPSGQDMAMVSSFQAWCVWDL